MKLTMAQIGEILGVGGASNQVPVTGYSIDSRTIRPGELFFAIRGPNFDGHDFVAAALQAGAAAAVVERGEGLRVLSALAALERLASEVRRRWGRRLVAVTGSTGKTSTKEMIAAALATSHRVLKSEGNLNNQYGVPLSLLCLEEEHQVGVVELGMSREGEIAHLARLAQPDTGVVTCVAPVHLEFFSGIQGIAAAKQELVQALPPDGTAVLNADDPLVSGFAAGFAGRTLSFGIEQRADFRAARIMEGDHGLRFTLEWAGEPVEVALALVGRHQVLNALAALAAAHSFGIPPGEAAQALAAFRPLKMRGELLECNGVTVLNDCYNSNPRALEFMLAALSRLPARGRRIAVLGEMRELGPASAELHREGGRRAAAAADLLVAVAGHARYLLEGAAAAGLDPARMAFFESPAEAGDYVASVVQPGDVVLFKASRGVKLEEALERVKS